MGMVSRQDSIRRALEEIDPGFAIDTSSREAKATAAKRNPGKKGKTRSTSTITASGKKRTKSGLKKLEKSKPTDELLPSGDKKVHKIFNLKYALDTTPRTLGEIVSNNSRYQNLLPQQEDELVAVIRINQWLLGDKPSKDYPKIREVAEEMLEDRKIHNHTKAKSGLGVHWVRRFIERRPDLEVINLDITTGERWK